MNVTQSYDLFEFEELSMSEERLYDKCIRLTILEMHKKLIKDMFFNF